MSLKTTWPQQDGDGHMTSSTISVIIIALLVPWMILYVYFHIKYNFFKKAACYKRKMDTPFWLQIWSVCLFLCYNIWEDKKAYIEKNQNFIQPHCKRKSTSWWFLQFSSVAGLSMNVFLIQSNGCEWQTNLMSRYKNKMKSVKELRGLISSQHQITSLSYNERECM